MPTAREDPARSGGPEILKRCLTKNEAAAYCGCNTLAAFDRWRAEGIVPDAIPGTNRWDRKAIDRALDRASGLVTDSAAELSPYQRWKAENAPQTEAGHKAPRH
ncbi:hypothetical protein [Bradyrhizobium sp. Gha]|uniref:hypothetical protein n=1 Tax=Bradyrhizobium sp. Gha TaxID=1855318 RepID=UPI0008E6EF4A|nr:hypothetical protein [Bradyrhizobium sp. Gha]SFI39704.1 hypothetical protein SAMN05216525_10861 [Bradyrhizobium sp. Gha]